MDRRAHTFDKDQPGESPGRRSQENPNAPTPSFDEGERRPTAIERTGDDGVREAIPSPPAQRKKKGSGEHREPDATMPPGEGRDPKRNTM